VNGRLLHDWNALDSSGAGSRARLRSHARAKFVVVLTKTRNLRDWIGGWIDRGTECLVATRGDLQRALFGGHPPIESPARA
jgi:hypothetical protein